MFSQVSVHGLGGGYVSSDDHQVSLAGGGYVSGVSMSSGGYPRFNGIPTPTLNMGHGIPHLVAATKTLAVGKRAVRILLEYLIVLSWV